MKKNIKERKGTKEVLTSGKNIENKTYINTKEVLTSEEVSIYLGISKNYLYKLTSSRKIPHFKPFGKMCYFNREEVEEWVQNNKISTSSEIETKSINYKRGGENK